MNTDTTSYETTDSQAPPPPRRLVRPVEGRSVAGVAAGLAHYLNMPVGLIRFGFLLAVVFGGTGLVLYVAGWLLIRDETESESIAQRLFDNLGAGPSWLGVALLILAAVIVVDNFTFMPGSLVWAVVLVVVGLLLYRGDLGARPDPDHTDRDQAGAPEATIADERPSIGDGDGPPQPPTDPPPRGTPPAGGPPAPTRPASILGRLTIGAGLLALGLLAVVDNLTDLIEPQPRHYVALATVVIGLGLVTGAFVGRARWMILLGIFLVPALLASPVAEVNWEGRFERVVAPADLEGFQGSYSSGAGSYLFDLTESDWNGENLTLDIELAAGEIVVVVPDGVGLTGSARVGIGAIEAPDGDRAGLGDISRTFSLAGERGTLDVDLEVGAGVIEIHTGAGPDASTDSWGMRAGPGHVSAVERTR